MPRANPTCPCIFKGTENCCNLKQDDGDSSRPIIKICSNNFMKIVKLMLNWNYSSTTTIKMSVYFVYRWSKLLKLPPQCKCQLMLVENGYFTCWKFTSVVGFTECRPSQSLFRFAWRQLSCSALTLSCRSGLAPTSRRNPTTFCLPLKLACSIGVSPSCIEE